jgi:membrane-bound acyltransferase YfiQ involved in biofilm formation
LPAFAAVMVAMLSLVRSRLERKPQLLISNISWIAGINLLVVFILYADRVLLRYFMNHPSGDKSQVY